jgi:adenylate cyclase
VQAPGEMSWWDRLAARTRPAGALATIETPRSVAILITGGLLIGTTFAGGSSVVFFRFGERTAGWFIATMTVAYVVAWVLYALTGSVNTVGLMVMVASIATQIGVHIALGGYANSGGYLMWGITMTFAVALMFGRTAATALGVFYVIVSIVFGFLEGTLSAGRSAPAAPLTATTFTVVFIGNLVVLTSVLVGFLVRLTFERRRSERLLLNVLPAEVATELKEQGVTKTRSFESVSVLFADVVGFTEMLDGMDPTEMVARLDETFTHFDTLADRYGCEKIRTIGDAYMVAAGLPTPRHDHAHALAAMALEMLDRSGPLRFRIGLHSGPVVAGVIGTRKFQYDIWGDTVNTASRMESHGEVGRIQVSEATYRLISEDFVCTPRGPIEVKGKGTLNTWYLDARRPPAASTSDHL